jgi:hypothetical protein
MKPFSQNILISFMLLVGVYKASEFAFYLVAHSNFREYLGFHLEDIVIADSLVSINS